MIRTVSLVGQNSNDIYGLHYPDNIMRFCKYDFSNFISRCTELCKKSINSGNMFQDEMIALRNTISSCHKFYEMNTRGLFEKIVIDLWIEYICREKNVGLSTLWNSFAPCRDKFEKAIFGRLTEYRHNKAINQWVNLLKIQEYAQKKIDFIFGEKIKDIGEARAKRDYFDLMVNVAANELGYPVEEFASSRVYSVGRLPNSPFILGGVSKEIANTVLSDIEFDSGRSQTRHITGAMSDQISMETFSFMKGFIPKKMDNVIETIIKTMRSMPKKVYVPEGFKTVIDLEIDLLLEDNALLQRCDRCAEYFVRDDEYDHNFCNRDSGNGKTCLEIMNQKPPISFEEMEKLELLSNDLYLHMLNRINVDMTQRDFGYWYKNFMTMRENIAQHNVSLDEMKNFVSFSKAMQFHISPLAENPVEEKEKQQPVATKDKKDDEKDIKPFVFKRLDRSVLYKQEKEMREREEEAMLELELLAEAEKALGNYEKTAEFQEIIPAENPTPQKNVNRVIKAQDKDSEEYPAFENPFDGVFDESINNIEVQFNEISFKPLGANVSEQKQNKNNMNSYKETTNKVFGAGAKSVANAYKAVAENTNIGEADTVSAEENNKPENASKGYYTESQISEIEIDDFDFLPNTIDKFSEINKGKTPASDFSGVLNNLEREDGFGKKEEKSENNPPQISKPESIQELKENIKKIRSRPQNSVKEGSHKTKRVMDAIFNPTKTTSNFVKNAEKNE